MSTEGLEPGRSSIPKAVRSQLPELSALHDQDFEGLCRSLMEKQDGISYALQHEPKGVSDQGVDVIGYRADGRTWVMQCKCVTKFGPAEISAASEEFFQHWDTKWKEYKIDSFSQ